MIDPKELIEKYVLIRKDAFNERFRVSDASLGCQDNWPKIGEQMIKFVKKVDASDNTILVSDNPDSDSDNWISTVRIVRILGDSTVSLENNSDEDFLMLI